MFFFPAPVNTNFLPGIVGGHVPGRAGVLLANQRPSNRRHVHVAVKHRVVLRDDHGQGLGARAAQPADDQTVFHGRDQHVSIENRDKRKYPRRHDIIQLLLIFSYMIVRIKMHNVMFTCTTDWTSLSPRVIFSNVSVVSFQRKVVHISHKSAVQENQKIVKIKLL